MAGGGATTTMFPLYDGHGNMVATLDLNSGLNGYMKSNELRHRQVRKAAVIAATYGPQFEITMWLFNDITGEKMVDYGDLFMP